LGISVGNPYIKEEIIMSNMVVQTNNLALNAHRNLGITGFQQARASARLSSGFRINTAADDAAGLAISETMRGQIRSLDQASRNAQDGISLIRTAEGGLATIGDMIIRVRELTTQAANDTNTDADRALIQMEVDRLHDEINDTASRVQFNTMSLLNGAARPAGVGDELFLQIGANTGDGTGVDWSTLDVTDDILDHIAEVDFAGLTGTQIADLIADEIDAAARLVNQARAHLGAWMNRLEFTIENLDLASENLSAANSRIRDADMAREMMRFTQTNVLQQAATSMLAQANQAPQNILQLLR